MGQTASLSVSVYSAGVRRQTDKSPLFGKSRNKNWILHIDLAKIGVKCILVKKKLRFSLFKLLLSVYLQHHLRLYRLDWDTHQ